jgi:hypothetical protein
LKRAAVDALLVKRWGLGQEWPRRRVRAARLKPRRERRGSDKTNIALQRIPGCLLMGCLVGCAAMVEPSRKREGSDQPIECAWGLIRAAPLEPRRERRGSDKPQKRAALGSLLLKPPGKGQGRGRV